MGLIRGVARTAVVAGTATAVSNRVSRRQAGRWAQQEQLAYDQEQRAYDQQQTYDQQANRRQANQQPATASSDPMEAKLTQLKSLADLKAQGILTDAEFEQQKAAILAD
jgi:Short C-terminal domain